AAIAPGLGRVVEIAMKREGVNFVITLLQHVLIPGEVGRQARPARAAGDELNRAVDVTHLPGGVKRLAAVLDGGHVADLPGPIHLIAEAPALDSVWRFDAVRAA